MIEPFRKSLVIKQARDSKLLRSFLNTLVFNTAINILGLVSGVVIAQSLGPAGRGEIVTAFLYVQLATWIAGLGLSRGNIYLLGKGKDLSQIFANSVWESLVVGGPVGFLLFLLMPALVSSFKPSSLMAIRLYALALPWLVLSDQIMNILLGCKEYTSFNIKRVIDPAVYALLVILFAVSGGALSVPIAVLALALGNVFGVIVGLWFLKDCCKLTLRGDSRLFKEALLFGLKAHLGDIAKMGNWRLDQVLMASLLGSYQVGLYSVGVSISEFLLLIPTAISAVLFPEVSSKEGANAKRLVLRVVTASSGFIIVAALSLFILAPYLIRVFYGVRFLEGIKACRVLIVAGIPFALSKVLQHGFLGLGRPIFVTYSSWISFALMVVGLLVFVPNFGILGAAGVSLFVYTLELLISWLLFLRG